MQFWISVVKVIIVLFLTSATVADVLYDYSIPKENVIGAVGDNTASMVATLKIIKSEYHPKCVPQGRSFISTSYKSFYRYCPGVSQLVKKCSEIVSFIDASPKFLTELERTNVNERYGRKPIPAGSTRWDGIQIMIESIVNQIPVINEALRKYRVSNRHLNPPERLCETCYRLPLLHIVLCQLRDFTINVQDRTASIELIITFYYSLRKFCTE